MFENNVHHFVVRLMTYRAQFHSFVISRTHVGSHDVRVLTSTNGLVLLLNKTNEQITKCKPNVNLDN